MHLATRVLPLALALVAAGCQSKPDDVSPEAVRAIRAKFRCASKPKGVTGHGCRILSDFAEASAITEWPRQGKSQRWFGRHVWKPELVAMMTVRFAGTPSELPELELSRSGMSSSPQHPGVVERLFTAAAAGTQPKVDDLPNLTRDILLGLWKSTKTYQDTKAGEALTLTSGKSVASASCKQKGKRTSLCRLFRRLGQRLIMVTPPDDSGSNFGAVAELWPVR